MSKVNLKLVAEKAGVSLATASRVLSGSDYPVKQGLRERVLQVAEELDYVPNANARGLLRGRSSTVGVIVDDIGDPYSSRLVRGIHEVADDASYMVTAMNTNQDPEVELEAIRRLRSQRVDIIIVSTSRIGSQAHVERLDKSLEGFINSGNSVVLISRQDISGELRASRILYDNVAAASQLATHLHELGHTEIVAVTDDQQLYAASERVKRLREFFPGLLVVETEPSRDGGYAAAGKLVAGNLDATAIVCTTDQLAFGVLARLRDASISVPGQVSVTGFNDIDFANETVPALTTVHVPSVEMGRRAMEVGLASLLNEDEIRTIEVDATLRVRGSTGPVPKA